jgi:hypothetical protein
MIIPSAMFMLLLPGCERRSVQRHMVSRKRVPAFMLLALCACLVSSCVQQALVPATDCWQAGRRNARPVVLLMLR